MSVDKGFALFGLLAVVLLVHDLLRQRKQERNVVVVAIQIIGISLATFGPLLPLVKYKQDCHILGGFIFLVPFLISLHKHGRAKAPRQETLLSPSNGARHRL